MTTVKWGATGIPKNGGFRFDVLNTRTRVWRRDALPDHRHRHRHARPRDRMATLALQERLSTVRRLDGLRIGVVDYAPGREVTTVQYHYQRSFVEDIRYDRHG
jgi:hypothetical protein